MTPATTVGAAAAAQRTAQGGQLSASPGGRPSPSPLARSPALARPAFRREDESCTSSCPDARVGFLLASPSQGRTLGTSPSGHSRPLSAGAATRASASTSRSEQARARVVGFESASAPSAAGIPGVAPCAPPPRLGLLGRALDAHGGDDGGHADAAVDPAACAASQVSGVPRCLSSAPWLNPPSPQAVPGMTRSASAEELEQRSKLAYGALETQLLEVRPARAPHQRLLEH